MIIRERKPTGMPSFPMPENSALKDISLWLASICCLINYFL